jgi:hypothetical protein
MNKYKIVSFLLALPVLLLSMYLLDDNIKMFFAISLIIWGNDIIKIGDKLSRENK